MPAYTFKRLSLFIAITFVALMAFFFIPAIRFSQQGMHPSDAALLGLCLMMLASGSLINRMHALCFPLKAIKTSDNTPTA